MTSDAPQRADEPGRGAMRTVESIHIDPVHARDPANLALDASALRALAQAAVTSSSSRSRST